ncbi:c-type cytochrome [Bacillus sp. OK048]|uniref:c-type cytochrome n=1 Tax=Bacillus sp. OK048 TaxID=1882761 RepID=UPI0008924DE6|nr:c-type cytochrome [Bacillus sp. OK048]SDM14884.1 cytochrome c oxidase cbb3-type subunit 3 [Bacillus sp. OK048]
MKKILYGLYILIIFGIVVCLINSDIFNKKNTEAIFAGEKVYKKQCLICHGETGKGEGPNAGTAINNQNYLNIVSDKDIYNSIKHGREGTGMPAYSERLSEKDLNNLVTFIRDWQKQEIEFEVPKEIAGNPETGMKLYNQKCLNCHGEAGVGKLKMGPALSNPQYLKFTTDQQIWITAAYGRENTSMGPSLKGKEGVRQLEKDEITDIVSYIRSVKVNDDSRIDYLEP